MSTSESTSGSTPSAKAEELARQMEQVNDAVIAFVKSCDETTKVFSFSCVVRVRTGGLLGRRSFRRSFRREFNRRLAR